MCRFTKFNTQGSLVRCGRCDQCYKHRAMEWYVRIWYELRYARSAYFVTLTYDDVHVPYSKKGHMTVVKRHLQNYFKRLRKREKGNTQIKYYAASEYGKKGDGQRPHYHAIILNVKDDRNLHLAWSLTDKKLKLTTYIGNVFIPPTGGVEDASIKYVTGYIGKRIGIPCFKGDDRSKEFSLMSKRFGQCFVDECGEYFKRNELGHIVINKCSYPLPRYFKDKLYPTTQEVDPRDLWIQYCKRILDTHDLGQAKAIMKHVPLSQFWFPKQKHPTLLKISKINYEKFSQAKINTLANFHSITDWGTNRIDVANSHNPGVKNGGGFKPRQVRSIPG